LGNPFNVAQYAALTHMVAHVTGHDTDRLIMVGGDCHLYLNSIGGVKEQLTRESVEGSDPRIVFKRKVDEIDDFVFEDIEIENYLHHDRIKMPVAV
jgi:thymidylate synthase